MATASFKTLFNVSCVLSEYQKSSLLKVHPDLSKLRKFSPVIYSNARITTIFDFVEKLDFTYFV